MNDRELLELAAKAVGARWLERHNVSGHPRADADGCVELNKFVLEGRIWNPLDDDGDALRLAVKLGIRTRKYPASYEAISYDSYDSTFERFDDNNNDQCKAARLAIVRVAAEIGRQMP